MPFNIGVLALLSAATETEVSVAVVHDSFVRNGRLISSVTPSSTTSVVVKCAHVLSILCGLSFCPVDRNLCVTVAVVTCVKTDLSAVFFARDIPHPLWVMPWPTSPWRGASSAGSSGRHVEGLPRQVVRCVFVITRQEKVLGKTTIAVEHGETRRFSSFGQLCFQTSDLTKGESKKNIKVD